MFLVFIALDPYLPPLSLSPGAPTLVLTAGPHSPGDESWDHSEAAGTQLWPNREHQQLPQPLRAAAHQCQARIPLLYLCLRVIKVIISRSHLGAWLLLYRPVLPLVTAHPSSPFVLPLSYLLSRLDTILHSHPLSSPFISSPPLLSFITTLSTCHPLIPFHCHGQIQFRVNPPPLCSEVTLPNEEEPMSSVLDDILLCIGEVQRNKSRLTMRASP